MSTAPQIDSSAASHLLAAAAAAPHTVAPTAGQSVTFWLLATVAVAAALGMIMVRKAVHCALMLAVVMLSLAVLYATQGAPFLAFVQVIVYTGAVLMLFLFVVMLIGVSSADSLVETIRGQRLAAGLAGIGLIVLLLGSLGNAALGGLTTAGPSYGSANLTAVARLVFTKYVYAFEVTSALLITAALGAMVLAHRERQAPKPSQRDLAQRRLESGSIAPLPGPGTYARHNAVDRPALLPDGRLSELSVSQVIAGYRSGEGAGPVLGPRRAKALEDQQRGQPEPGQQGLPGTEVQQAADQRAADQRDEPGMTDRAAADRRHGGDGEVTSS